MNTAELNHQDFSFFSDMFKDTYGFRPSAGFFPKTRAEYDAEIDRMAIDLEREMLREKNEEQRAWETFCALLSTLQANLGIDKPTAVRWLMESENCRDDSHDRGFFLYLNGLGMSRENEVFGGGT
jgi:hypothetical protein